MAEVTQCPQCQRKLNVQEAQLGQTVQCPVCGTFFTAAVVGVQRGPTLPPPRDDPPPPRYDEPPPPRPRYDDRRPGYPDDYGRGRGYGPPGRGYGGYRDPYAEPMPHRGGAILALGLTAMLLSCIPLVGWIMGGIALSMANTDLPRIDRGYMDREGRGLTVGGQVCAVIAVVISSICALIVCSGLPQMMR
jgi:predicted Zn finger-like uncharacterized protein